MLKGIKNLVNKIKFKFKGPDNQEFEIGEQIDYLPKEEELAVDLASGEEFIEANTVKVVKGFNPSEYCFEIKKLDKHKKTFLLRGLYGKDKGHLIHILINTRKPRVRKKLVKRIIN